VAKAATRKPEPKSELVILDVVQGSDDWRAARKGLVTASVFSTVMASGKDGGVSIGRTKLLHKLAAETITGEVSPEGYQSQAMMKGSAMESEARESYARRKGVEVQQVGLVKNFGGLKACGASPDGLLGFDGGLEIKIATEAHILIPMLQRPAAMPSEHRAQIQGGMWICERSWWDLTIYHHRSMPAVDIRIYRDESYIQQLSNEIERFNFELRRLIESLRKMGAAG
jgi:hypothetical protein